ncbi:MAG: hypothetical protein GY873_30005 [Bosea sp.]|uniref:hypothetical protein n=1 Tax=Bosea sp. (in: a-proteobacteria) TaxID=1871050 RepID=UPI002385154B|nr:hypothetical protein [Bosea sp. (in: a-proteobacteria)]MCP4738429.1 hypothetical protein [Bosea sp. (in: a-proteobacteria)]
MTDTEQVTSATKSLAWYRRFWPLRLMLLAAVLVATIAPVIGLIIILAPLAIPWSGPTANQKGELVSPLGKAVLTALGFALIGWQFIQHEAGPGRPRLGENGYPICDSRFMKHAVVQALNNGPAARRGGFEASEVLDSISVTDLPIYKQINQPELRQLMEGKCQHNVLTNQGQQVVTSSFQWVDKTAGRYFVDVE